VARRATVIENVRASESRVLVLDAGNALTGQDIADNSRGAAIVDVMNILGYDALAIGERELYLELPELLALAEEAEFSVLSANVVYRETGELVFEPYTVIDLDGLRVGIVGLTNANAFQITVANRTPGGISQTVQDRVEIADPTEALKAVLPEVAAKADLVMALSHLSVPVNQRLMADVPGLAAVVSGGSRQLLTDPAVVGETLMVQAGYDGEWLGWLSLDVTDGGGVARHENQIITLGPEIEDHTALSSWVRDAKQKYAQP
jgi:2',3'-cyclic-nucleotide 2'-phosphodiesterase (5'-nucleotidase family)